MGIGNFTKNKTRAKQQGWHKEEYTNGHDCTVVDNTNVNKKIMIMKKHITARVPVCSVCGWYGHDECDATPYCPNCGAKCDI